MATRCINPECPIGKGKGELWLPPRADCPDCHQPMVWEEVKNPEGYIYAYTYVERGGTGLEIECPYYQIDVKIEGRLHDRQELPARPQAHQDRRQGRGGVPDRQRRHQHLPRHRLGAHLSDPLPGAPERRRLAGPRGSRRPRGPARCGRRSNPVSRSTTDPCVPRDPNYPRCGGPFCPISHKNVG